MCGESGSHENDSAPQEQVQETMKLCPVSQSKHSIHESKTPEKETQGRIMFNYLFSCTTPLIYIYIPCNNYHFELNILALKQKQREERKGQKKVFLRPLTM